MGVGTLLQVSWCTADESASGVGRSAPCTVGPVFIAGLSAIPVKGCTVVVLFLSLWPFDFPQRPLVSISFVVADTADVCH
jgi:tellurite resistance protein TehA-like permease